MRPGAAKARGGVDQVIDTIEELPYLSLTTSCGGEPTTRSTAILPVSVRRLAAACCGVTGTRSAPAFTR